MIENKLIDYVYLKEYPEVIQTDFINSNDVLQTLKNSYILTDGLIENLYEPIIENILVRSNHKNGSTLVVGPYGSGKSYFLLILNSLLNEIYEESNLWLKFKKYHKLLDISSKYTSIQDNKILAIPINMVGKSHITFNEVICSSLIEHVRNIVPEFTINSEFDEAIKAINNFSALTKEDFVKKLGIYLISLEQLLDKLKNKDNNALELYYKVSEKVINRPISRYDLVPRELVKNCLSLIKEKGYSKIVFLVDEFAQFIYAWSSKPDLALIIDQIQDLIQYINASQGNISFIGIMHQKLESLFIDKGKETIYTKLMGRFDEIYINKVDMVDLIQGQFEIKRPIQNLFSQATFEISNLNKLSRSYNIKNFWTSYPFAPQVIRYLPIISRGLAQENRTTFKFLRTKFEEVKNYELNKDSQIFIVNIDDIFDYYLPSMHVKDPNMMAIFNRVSEFCNSELSIKILKILLVFNLVGRYYSPDEENNTGNSTQRSLIETGATIGRLQELLMAKDRLIIEKACEPLLDSGFIHKSSVNNQLAILPGAGITNEEINRELQSVSIKTNPKSYLFKLINEYLYILGIDRRYEIINVVSRTINSNILSYRDLLQININKTAVNNDGEIIFAIPDVDDLNDLELREKVIAYAESCKSPNIAIAIVKDINLTIEALINHEAYQLIKNKFLENDHAMQVINRKESEITKVVKSQLQNVFQESNFNFYYNGPIQINTVRQVLNIMLKKYYFKFPFYNIDNKTVVTQNVNGRITTNKLFSTIIINGEFTFPENSSREEHRQIMEFLLPLGFIKVLKSNSLEEVKTVLITPEESSICYEVWNIIHHNAFNDISEIYRVLQARPYGIPYYIIELLIAIYVKLGQADIFDISLNRIVGLSQNVINDISTKQSSKYKLCRKEKLSDHDYLSLNQFSLAVDKSLGGANTIVKYSDSTILDAKTNQQIEEHIKLFTNKLLNKYITVLKSLSIDAENLEVFHTQLQSLNGKTIFEKSKELSINLKKIIDEIETKSGVYELSIPDTIMELSSIYKFWDEIQELNNIVAKLNMDEKCLSNYKDLARRYNELLEVIKEQRRNLLINYKIKDAISRIKDFLTAYMNIYNKEHTEYNAYLDIISLDIKGHYSYRLLSQLRTLLNKSQYDIEVEGMINDQLKKCYVGIESIEKVISNKIAECPECNYVLGSLNKIVEQKNQVRNMIIQNIQKRCSDYLKYIYSKLYEKRSHSNIGAVLLIIEKVMFSVSDQEEVDKLIIFLGRDKESILAYINNIDENEKMKAKKYKINSIIGSFTDYCAEEMRDDMTLEEVILKIFKWVELLKSS